MKHFLKGVVMSFLYPVLVVFGILVLFSWIFKINEMLAISFGLVSLWWVARQLLAEVLKYAVADLLWRKDGLRREIAGAFGIMESSDIFSHTLRNEITEAIQSREVQATLSETIQDAIRMAGD
jgi:hypothetical protein